MRARTAAAAVLALTPVLAVAGVAGVAVQRHQLTQAAALVAEDQARTVAGQLHLEPPTGGDSVPRSDLDLGVGTLGGEETLLQVVDARSGRILSASPALADRSPVVQPPGSSGIRRTEVSGLVPGESDEYVAVGASAGPGTYVVAARSLESVDAAVSSTTRLLAVGLPLVVLVAGGLTWILTGRALAPVDRMRRRAAEITTAGSGMRLPEIDTGDELARLAKTLNEMFARIDSAARFQRQFIADASHELRSPVAAIRAVMEVSKTTDTDLDELRRDVLAENHRLERLVDALLALAKRDAAGSWVLDTELLRLSEVMEAQLARPRRLAVSTRVDCDPVVRADRQALETLLGNLLDNADRHGRSSIVVEVTERLGDDADLRGEGFVYLSVSDDGSGIPREQAERVFDRFVRLDEARTRDAGGAGLGLAIARAIAEDHGGWIRSMPGERGGACFMVAVPVVPGPQACGVHRAPIVPSSPASP